MAKRMRMRDGAGRQHRAATAPQTQARRPRRSAFSRRRRIELGADRARENPRESAADSRKQARRPAQGARTAKRQGVTAISRLPNPRDARRNARIPPCRRAPGIGRTYTTHESVASFWFLVYAHYPAVLRKSGAGWAALGRYGHYRYRHGAGVLKLDEARKVARILDWYLPAV